MAKKTDTTTDDPDLLGEAGQSIPEYKPPDYEVIGADGGLFGGGLGINKGSPADALKGDIEYASGYYPGKGIVVNPNEAAKLGLDTGNIFLSNPNWGGLTAPVSTVPAGPAIGSLSGATPGISPGTGVGDQTGGPIGTTIVNNTAQRVVFDDIVRDQINKEIALLGQEGIPSNDERYGTRIMDAANRGAAIYDAQTAPARNVDVTAGIGTSQPQGGIPLIIPIPGLGAGTAALLTAAGLIFSGGKIARLNQQNPVGSVLGAVQGIGQTGQNVIDVATGKTNIGEILDPGSTGAPSGTTGTGTGAATGGSQQMSGTGSIGIAGGILGGGLSSGGATTGGQQTTGGGSVPITGGALGGQAGGDAAPGSTAGKKETGGMPSTGGPYIYDQSEKVQNILGQILAPSQAINQQKAEDQAAAEQNRVGTPSPIGSGKKGGDVSIIDQQTPVVSDPYKDVDNTGKPPGSTVVTPNTSSVTPTTTTTTTSGTAATPIVINAPSVGYTLPTQGTPAQRNLYTEAGTTLASLASPMRQFQIGVDAQGQPIYGTVPSGEGGQPLSLSQAISQGYGGLSQGMTQQDITNLLNSIRAQTGYQVQPGQAGGYQGALTQAASEQTAAANTALRAGNIADVESLAARAQALRQQANPQLFGDTGTLGQYATAAQNQVARDIAALRSAEQGNLTPEEVRNAQQAAREAYAARGQVFSQGAAAQEVLNRQAAVQQRQQLARQNLAQSMGQLGQGVAYQTANIFDPMAAVLGGQYGMQSQNVGLNQALYNQAMGLTSGAGGYGFAQQMINPFSGYAQDVYGTNVNAANAAQIAAANRQAALEAAKMGQTGTYAQAAGNLIASGGLGQIQSGITGGVQGLLSLLGGKWPTS